MFGSIGFPELMLILGIALLVFGPRKLPEMAQSLGKALGEFRHASHQLKTTLETEVKLEEDSRSSTTSTVEPQPPSSPTLSRSDEV